jgi:hypothetical protein
MNGLNSPSSYADFSFRIASAFESALTAKVKFAAASALWISIHDSIVETRRREDQSQACAAAVAGSRVEGAGEEREEAASGRERKRVSQ